MMRFYLNTHALAAPDGRGARSGPRLILNEDRTAEVTGLSKRTLQRYRQEGGGPPYCRLAPGRVGYPSDALEAWIASRTYASTAAEAAEQAKAVAR